MASFEETQGTILEASVGSGQSQYKTSSGYKYRTSYFPQIVYQYSVNGAQYQNGRFAQRQSLISRKGMIENIVNDYPVGASVTVYYDPQNPTESFLQKGYGAATNKILYLSLLFTMVIVVAIVVILLLA